MRKSLAIVKSTALEILSEPLTLLVTLAALTVAVLAPVFHYHQFGEPTRMARDAGLSSLLMGAGIIAVFSTIRAFRREIESGTMEMALAHPVSRLGFFLAKTLGSFLALQLIVVSIFAVALTMVIGADVGAKIAEKVGGLITVFGPFVAGGVAIIMLPMILGAFLNRFVRCRFVLTTLLITFFLALVLIGADLVAAALFKCAETWLLRLLPTAFLITLFDTMLLCAAAAFAVRFPANGAAAAVGAVVVVFIPFLGNFYPAGDHVLLVFAATLPMLVAFLMLGGSYVRRFDH